MFQSYELVEYKDSKKGKQERKHKATCEKNRIKRKSKNKHK